MATDAVNISEDAEMADYDGDKVVTMMDVLQEQQEFEDDANAVLGASDDKNCTYPKGYIKRQALYACLTCCNEAKTDPTKRAGVCLACSLLCHENHDLIELYTKRNFRCDCGNPKFNTHPCQFTSSKTDLNEDNIYNQNFSGLYCPCHRPYPDPDTTLEDDDMIQCIICEDWLHASHLEATVPANDQYSEMVCKGCMEKNEFLHDYTGFAVNLENGDVDIIAVNNDAKTADNSLCNGDLDKEKLVNGVDGTIIHTKTAENGQINGDVEMNDDTKKRDDSSETTESNTTEKNTTSDTSEETKVEKPNTLDTATTELKDPEVKQIETKEQQSTEQEEPVGNEDTPIKNDEPNATIDKVPDVQSGDMAEQNETTVNEDKTLTKEEESNTISENATIEQTDTDKQNIEQTTSVEKSNENSATQPSENPEQVLDEDSIPTSDKVKSDIEKEITSEEKPSEALSEATKVSEDNTTAEKLKETEEKSDSVMDAIDEILDAASSDKKQENKDDASAPTDMKESIEAVDSKDSKDSGDVEMSSIEKKIDENVSEGTEKPKENEVKCSTDVEMNDNATEKQQVTENKTDKESVDSVKDVDSIATDSVESTKVANGIAQNENVAVKETKEDDLKDGKKSSELVETEKIDQVKATEIAEESTNEKESKDVNRVADAKENTGEHKRKLSIDLSDDVSSKKAKLDAGCARPRGVKRMHIGATFWPSNFRQKLCTCGECIAMYKDLNVLFLTDMDDTVSAYESLGKENAGGASQYEKGLEALSSLDRIQQINALTEYNKMRDKLLDFLKSFKDRKEIVKEEDIKAFFAGMKPRREPDGVYFCR